MRIAAVFNQEIAGAVSGSWISFERIAARVSAAGHRIEVLSWPEAIPSGPGDPAVRLRASRAAFAARLEQHWRQDRPDVVHIEMGDNVGHAALDAAIRLGLPTSSSFHHLHLHASPADRERALAIAARFHARTSATIATFASSARLLLATGGPCAQVVPDGVDTDQFHPRHRSESVRSSWGCVSDAPVLFWAGRMVAVKGFDLMVRTCAAVRTAVPGVRVVLAGDGPELPALRASLPWAVFPGVLRGDAIATAFASADIFVFPSPAEPWGNALVEAAASGLAVVARSGGSAEDLLLPHGACIAPLPDGEDFVAAVLALVRDPVRRVGLGRAARAAAETVDLAATSAQWLELWTRLAAAAKPRPRQG